MRACVRACMVQVNLERTLWLIFTYHTIHSDPNEPEHLNSRGFQNICKECKLVDEKKVLSADLQVIFTSQASKRAQRYLDFAAFLDALMAVISKIEPGRPAFERIIRSNVIPQASRRSQRHFVSSGETELGLLKNEFASGLEDIFGFYASASSRLPSSGSGSRSSAKLRNKMNDALGYVEFRNFALDFGFTEIDLSAVDLADIFLMDLADRTSFDPSKVPGKISFAEFWCCLVRCAQLAFARFPVDDARRLKALFTHCWRAIQDGVPRAIAERKITQSYAGNLLQGCARFSGRFVAKWKADGFVDYLLPPAAVEVSGLDVVRKM